MKLSIRPISFSSGNNDGYGLYILGFGTLNNDRAIGFVIRPYKETDRKVWKLHLSLYCFYKHIILKTVLDDYYVRCDCGGLVRKENGYCQRCGDYPYNSETTYVYRNAEPYKDIMQDLIKEGCKVEYETI